LCQREQSPGVFGEDLARLAEVDTAADPIEKVNAKGAFELLHLLGHRGLADVQALGP
jgi:hypothetical protein